MSGFDSLGYGLTVPGDAPAPLSAGAIVGIVFAVAAALLLAAVLVYCFCFRKRARRTAAAPPLAGILGAGDAMGSAFRAPRLSVDDAASTDELLEIRRSSSSRF